MRKLVSSLKANIVNGNIVGSYLENINDISIVFVHAGFRQQYLNFLSKNKYFLSKYPNGVTSSSLVDYVNNEVINIVNNTQCINSFIPSKCYFNGGSDGQLYEAGKERGGSNIGGPFWTDYSIIEDDAYNGAFKPDIIQIVGHSMAYCYDPRNPDVHPPESQAECSLGLIRPSTNLRSICVDGGMYAGARTYLEITPDKHFRTHQLNSDGWAMRDLTQHFCNL